MCQRVLVGKHLDTQTGPHIVAGRAEDCSKSHARSQSRTPVEAATFYDCVRYAVVIIRSTPSWSL